MATAQKTKEAASAAQDASNEIAIPAALLNEAVSIAKAAVKQQHATALFGGRVMEQGFAFRQVMSEACKAAGIERSRLEGLVSNANPFLAAARLVARGEMSEKQFFALKHKECTAAFKAAGGAKEGGFEPEAWQSAFEENAAAAAAEKVKGKPAAATDSKAAKMSAADFIAGVIDLRGSELTSEEIDSLQCKLERLRK